MSKAASSTSVLTANRLGDGAVVFLDYDGVWVEQVRGAAIARSPDEMRALQDRGAHDAARNLVVEPYLIEMQEIGGSFVPVRFRERVRVAGPSILAYVPGYTPTVPVVRQAHHQGEASVAPPELVDARPQSVAQAEAA
ncbi:MAG: DUF2849 domain-containing protein [Hyphomicrobiaceae bacterium]|nr:MAG: DUF2849 domain-containing protein [Hyphomicrobiaceae bacterium]